MLHPNVWMTPLPRPPLPLTTRPALPLAVRGAALVLVLLLLPACARTIVAEPLETNYPPADAARELAFWHLLPTRSAVSNDEGFHGLLLLADGVDESGSYQRRVELLKSRGWLRAGFDEPGDLAMQRGTLAAAICGILEIRGGVMMRLLGPTPRYATRELAAMGMIPAGSSELQAITGLEYMGVISKAQDYLVLREARAQPPRDQTPAP
jgi:hypothetical protein